MPAGKLVKTVLRISRRMLIGLVVVVGLLLLALLVLEKHWGNAIVQRGLGEVNSKLRVPISTSAVDFTFFGNFPHASLHLHNVYVPSTRRAGEGRADTLLIARSVFLVLNPFDLIRGEYRIESFRVVEGFLNLKVDRKGLTNYDLLLGQADSTDSTGGGSLLLDRFQLDRIAIRYDNAQSGVHAKVMLSTLEARGNVGGDSLRLGIRASGLLDKIRQGEFLYANRQQFGLNATLALQGSQWALERTRFDLDRTHFGVEGYLDLEARQTKLAIQSSNIDLGTILAFASQYHWQLPAGLECQGAISANLNLEGSLLPNQNLRVAMGIAGANLKLVYQGQDYTVSTLQGQFTNGANGTRRATVFEVTKCHIARQESHVNGRFRLSNLDHPSIYLRFDLALRDNQVVLPQLAPYLQSYTSITALGECLGSATSLDRMWHDILQNPRLKIELDFDGVDLTPTQIQSFTELHGAVTLINQDLVKGAVGGQWNGSTFSLGLNTKHFLGIFNGKGGSQWTVHSALRNYAIPDGFIPQWDSNPNEEMPPDAREEREFNLWDRVQSLNGQLALHNCTYRGGIVDSLDATLRGDRHGLHLYLQQGRLFDGYIRGKIGLQTPSDKAPTLTAELYPDRMDIQRIFRQFDNFGQDALTSENIEGRLTGGISLYAPLRDGALDLRRLQVRANVNVHKGALRNMKALEQLATFIDIKELQDIRFSTLSNTISVFNQRISIPKMNIHSSALDLSLHGEQHLDSRFEYHVGLRLGDLLFNRFRSQKHAQPEQGMAEADEEVGGSLFLIVEGDSTRVDVRYDQSALKERIKARVQQEKEEIQTLFQEEFGSNAANTRRAKPRARPRIEWDEADSASEKRKANKANAPIRSTRKKKRPSTPVVWDED